MPILKLQLKHDSLYRKNKKQYYDDIKNHYNDLIMRIKEKELIKQLLNDEQKRIITKIV
jgi:hypothetical protein